MTHLAWLTQKAFPIPKKNSNDKSHNCFKFLEINSHRKIGRGQHKISVEKIEMQLVSPYIVADLMVILTSHV